MDIQAVRKTVARIKSSLFKNANSYSVGMLKSHFRGSGLQFREHQIYVPGDDVKFLDWKMLAKTNIPYVKTFEEERNVEIAVVIDASTTMFSGDEGISKLEVAIEICCLLYLLAKESGDYVHGIIFTDEVINIPKKSGEQGIISLISVLQRKKILDDDGNVNVNFVPRPGRKKDERLAAITKHLARRKEIVLLSDFHEFFSEDVLRKLVLHSNVHCFQVLAPVDEAEQVPFSIYARQSPFSASGDLYKINLSGKKDIPTFLGKKFKKLRVNERYLEDFIKEML
jgi:uncharacterized protein (DUF58 family)